MLPLILALCFASAFLFVIGAAMKTEREIMRERVERYSTAGEMVVSPLHVELQGTFGDRVIRPFLRSVSSLVTALTPAGVASSLDAKLETAGHPWKLGVKEFLGLWVLCVAASLPLAWLFYHFVHGDRPGIAILGGALVVFVGFLAPHYALQKTIYNRQTKIRKALPDTIDLLTVSVEAGVGFDGAMSKVSERVRGPLTEELIRALEEMRLGKSRMQALHDMAGRIGLVEVSTFVAALYQAEQLGVSIAKVLRVQGETMRTRRSQRARELASKLPVKLLFPLVFFVFPSLFVVLLGPGAIQIYKALSE